MVALFARLDSSSLSLWPGGKPKHELPRVLHQVPGGQDQHRGGVHGPVQEERYVQALHLAQAGEQLGAGVLGGDGGEGG